MADSTTKEPVPGEYRRRELCAEPGDFVYWRPSPGDERNQKLSVIVEAGHFSATIMNLMSGAWPPKPHYQSDCHPADYVRDNPQRNFTNGCFVPFISTKEVMAVNADMVARSKAQDEKIAKLELATAAAVKKILGVSN